MMTAGDAQDASWRLSAELKCKRCVEMIMMMIRGLLNDYRDDCWANIITVIILILVTLSSISSSSSSVSSPSLSIFYTIHFKLGVT